MTEIFQARHTNLARLGFSQREVVPLMVTVRIKIQRWAWFVHMMRAHENVHRHDMVIGEDQAFGFQVVAHGSWLGSKRSETNKKPTCV